MPYSYLTNGRRLTSDSSPRPGKIDRFIVHHAATTSLAAILDLFQPGGREVSANYALGSDGTLINTVDESRRAWTSASSYWDGRAVTIEVANSVAGGSWPVSDAAFDKLARLIADVATRYGFPINDDTVLTHQELYLRYGDSYATACPGGIQPRKAELLALARKYQATLAGLGASPVPPARKKTSVTDRTYYARIDAAGKDDGEWMIAGVDLFNDPDNDPSKTGVYTFDGYWVTTSLDIAIMWARQYSFYPPETLAVRLTREPYIAQQTLATKLHKAWVAGMRTLLNPAA